MKLLILLFLVVCLFGLACDADTNQSADKNTQSQTSGGDSAKIESVNTDNTNTKTNTNQQSEDLESTKSQTDQPKTVREFFNILPEKYFALEGCNKEEDKNCDKARAEYIKNYLEIEDIKNGYWKSGCDGAQSCLTMALFKRPDSSYIVHLLTEFEGGEESHFLDYKNGKWTDIGSQIIPQYSAKNIYIPPRIGTTVEVFKKNFPEPNYSERGEKLYDLVWKDGKFSRQK